MFQPISHFRSHTHTHTLSHSNTHFLYIHANHTYTLFCSYHSVSLSITIAILYLHISLHSFMKKFHFIFLSPTRSSSSLHFVFIHSFKPTISKVLLKSSTDQILISQTLLWNTQHIHNLVDFISTGFFKVFKVSNFHIYTHVYYMHISLVRKDKGKKV